MGAVDDKVHRFGRDNVNWYLVEGDEGVTVVDAGVPRHWLQLTAHLNRSGIPIHDVRAVLITHAHPDHVGFAERARQQGATVYVHVDDDELVRAGVPVDLPDRFRRHLWRPRVLHVLSAWVRGGMRPWRPARGGGGVVPEVTETVTVGDGDRLDVPGRPRVLHLPGHTPGSVAYVFDDHDVVCTGDALVTADPVVGHPGIGVCPTGLSTDDDQALASLRRLADLDVGTVLPGHGQPYHHGCAGAVQAALAIGADW